MIDVEKMTPNRSKTYLLPLLSEFYSFPDSVLPLLKNTYISDTSKNHKYCIYLLFRYDNTPEFRKFEYELTKTEGFVKHYDLKNNLILFVINFPKDYMIEYFLFQEGKYSEYGVDAQNLIIRYLRDRKTFTNIIDRVQQIFDKDPKLKAYIERKIGQMLLPNSELGEIMNEDDETININKNIINHYDA